MRLENIKTKKEFYEFADIWYQRVHQLRFIWQDEAVKSDQRAQALRLWKVMCIRVLHLSNIALRLSQPLLPKNLKKGGYETAKLNKMEQ